jgi:predicted  nucleic acid-binding Zn-ribbon protein
MRELPYQTRMTVLDLYLQGLSADRVAEQSGVSKGAVISIIKDAREGKYPQLELKNRVDELHQMAVRLRKEKLDIAQAGVGFSLFRRLAALGIEPERVAEWLEFCEKISPSPPDGFVMAAMALLRVEKETGLSYAELTAQVDELASRRQQLMDAIGDLETKEKRSGELKTEIGQGERRASELKEEKDKLEGEVSFLNRFIEKKAEALGITPGELEAKFKELVNLEAEIADKRSEHRRLQGEVEALKERHEKLSSQMEKASADFERDINLIRQTRQELAEVAEMKGRYEAEVADMAWAKQILPFLRYPDKVDDPAFKLASVVVDCIDKWLSKQNLGLPWGIKWGDITRHVQSKRAQFRESAQ